MGNFSLAVRPTARPAAASLQQAGRAVARALADWVASRRSALGRESLEPLISQLCRDAAIDAAEITEASAAGNTVMLHTLAGVSLEGLRAYPFQSAFQGEQEVASGSLGLSGDFMIRCPTCPGPFVGADITMGAWASGMLELPGPSLLIDIGTNGEILLKHQGGYLATATAAGPAFEGGRLTCGAAASDDVISRLERNASIWEWTCCDARNRRPIGISGAAYVDFIAEARAGQLLGEMGRFDQNHPEVKRRQVDDESELYVTIAPTLTISESDVAEIIQAKAAMVGGIMTLLELADLRPPDLRTIYVAGGFGYYIEIRHAMAIGLLPTVPLERVDVVGNAALGGASLLLQSKEASILKPFLETCQVVELNQCQGFEDHFIDSMALEPVE